MTNIKLNNKKLITIIIANTKYAINSVPIYHVKAGNNIVQYKPIGKFSNDERTLLNQSLKEGYVYINEAYTLLKKAKADTLEKVESILGELEESTLGDLVANIKQIQDKILSPKLVVLKENYLDTEKDHILASVKEDDTFTFTVYENFFDKKEFKDNRAGVIIHEIAHLCDMEEGADMYDLDSAECLKNIILHLNDKITLDEIQAEYTRKQEPQERDDDTLTYRPNPNRRDNGEFDYGPDNGSGGASKSGYSSDKTTNSSPFAFVNRLNGSDGKYMYNDSSIAKKLNLDISYFDATKPPSIDDIRKSYMEPRIKKTQLLNAMTVKLLAKYTWNKSLDDLYNKIRDTSLIGLNLVGKVYSTVRLFAIPFSPTSLRNPDFLKTSTLFAWNNGGTFYFDEKSPWTKDLKNHKHFINKKNEVISQLSNNTIKEGKTVDVSLSYGGGVDNWTTAKQFLSDGMNVITFGTLGTQNSYTTGSIGGKCTVEKINHKEKSAILRFDLEDHFGMGSATRNPITRGSFIDDNPKLSTGKIMMENLYLNWTWTENVSF